MMLEDTAETRLAQTLFCVEATSFERYSLWCNYAHHSHSRLPGVTPIKWEQAYKPDGWLVTVGKLAKKPVCIDISWDRLDGQMICFYRGCSRVTDSVMIEKWMRKHFKGVWDGGRRLAMEDAQNFHTASMLSRRPTNKVPQSQQSSSSMSSSMSECINTWDQLNKAKAMGLVPVAIGPYKTGTRKLYVGGLLFRIGALPCLPMAAGVKVWHLTEATDPKENSWCELGTKKFRLIGAEGDTYHQRMKWLIEQAKAWVKDRYGVVEWERNRSGDLVPAPVNTKYPLAK